MRLRRRVVLPLPQDEPSDAPEPGGIHAVPDAPGGGFNRTVEIQWIEYHGIDYVAVETAVEMVRAVAGGSAGPVLADRFELVLRQGVAYARATSQERDG